MAEKRDVEPGCTGAWVDAKDGPILMHWINTLPCPVHANKPRDWPAFWRSLPPREAWEAAKAMPKVAGPWMRVPHRDRPLIEDWRRRGLGVGMYESDVVEVWDYRDEAPEARPAYSSPGAASEGCASVDDGKRRADAALRAAGWILVDEETKPDAERTTRLAADGHWYRVDPHNTRLLLGGCTCCHPEPEEGGRG